MRLVLTKDPLHGVKVEQFTWAVGGENQQSFDWSFYNLNRNEMTVSKENWPGETFYVRHVSGVLDLYIEHFLKRRYYGSDPEYFVTSGATLCYDCGIKEIREKLEPLLEAVDQDEITSFTMEINDLLDPQWDYGDSPIYGGMTCDNCSDQFCAPVDRWTGTYLHEADQSMPIFYADDGSALAADSLAGLVKDKKARKTGQEEYQWENQTYRTQRREQSLASQRMQELYPLSTGA